MSDWAAKWTAFGSLWVNVNPLVVASCISEEIHLLLGHGVGVAVAEVGTDE